jgi:hypothetical protein
MTLRAALIDETSTDAGAILLDQSGAQLAVVDSTLAGTAAAAIEVTDAGVHHLFARNVTVAGFGVGIDQAGMTAAAGSVTEYVSDPVVTLYPGQPPASLNLPVLDAPLVPWFDAGTQWANVDDFGAAGDGGVDDTGAIQAALNSGLPVVYFPRRVYRVTKTLQVPASVQRLEVFDANLDNATFAISAAAPTPVLIRDTTGYGQVQSAATRDVVLQLTTGAFENPQDNPINLFLENCANIGGGNAFTVSGQHTYARSLNDEEGGTQADAGFNPATATADMQVEGGSLWVLNFKTENKPIPALSALPGAFVEVLGGYVNVTVPPGDIPMIVNNGAKVSFLGFTNLFCSELQTAIEEFRDGGAAAEAASSLPARGFDGCFTVPLYVGYDPSSTP